MHINIYVLAALEVIMFPFTSITEHKRQIHIANKNCYDSGIPMEFLSQRAHVLHEQDLFLSLKKKECISEKLLTWSLILTGMILHDS